MSIDSLVSQIERLTITPLEVKQKPVKQPYMFACVRAYVVKTLLDKNKDHKLSLPLAQKVLTLIDSICSSKCFEGMGELRSKLIKTYEIEDTATFSVCDQIRRITKSFFSYLTLNDVSESLQKFSITEEHLKTFDKCAFWKMVKEKQVDELVVYRVNKPPMLFSGHVLDRLLVMQVELNTLAEDFTLRLDSGEIIGMVSKALFALCDRVFTAKSVKCFQESLVEDPSYPEMFGGVYSRPTYSKVVTKIEVKEISVDGFCDMISMVTTGKFDDEVIVPKTIDPKTIGGLKAVMPKVINSDAISTNDLFAKDLLNAIFSHVSNNDFLTCRRVCQAWKRALQEPTSWNNRIFPLNISSGICPPFAIFFSPINYDKDDEQWRAIKHRIRDIVRLAKDGHIGAQIEVAQRVLLKKGNYDISYSTMYKWLNKCENSLKRAYFKGALFERLEVFGVAIIHFRESAENGYAPAQNRMGVYYRDGKHVEKDLVEAAKWFLLAAEQDYVEAQRNLGDLHFHSNKDEYLKWMLRAALQGDARGQNSVGVIVYDRRRDLRDVKEALQWFEAAADQYLTNAQFNLGFLYETNQEIRDFKKARKWYLRAADGQPVYAQAQYRLGLLCYNGQGGPVHLGEAANWYFLAAEQGVARAQYDLGKLLFDGHGVAQDLQEAFKWLHSAAEQGLPDAQYRTACMYREGNGVLANPDEAIKWLHSAAEQGHTEACALLGALYRGGDGVQVNVQEAFKWYEVAAKNDHMDAQYILGIMYANGEGVDINLEAAFECHLRSAQQGHKRAQYSLAYKYEHGIGVAKDIKAAIKWYEFAALGEFGSAEEKSKLEDLITRLRML